MMKKQIKIEFPNEVDILRTTLAELKVKLPGLDEFLLANPECAKCSNSKEYVCVQLKGKAGCRTCTTRRISCSRHIQYLVETAASRLEWSVEKTKSMYDKYVKQTRNGKKSPSRVKKVTIRKATDSPRKFASDSAADQTLSGGGKEKPGVTAFEEDDHEGDGGGESQDKLQLIWDYLQEFSDGLEEDEEDEEDDDHDPDWVEGTDNNVPHSISKVILRVTKAPTSLSTDPQEEIPTPRPQVTIPVLEPEHSISSGPGLQDPLWGDLEERLLAGRADDPISLTQPVDEPDRVPAATPRAESQHPPESSMGAEQRIKQLEKQVAKLEILRVADATSISRLTKKADMAFDNMSVLLGRIRIHRQELDAKVTKHVDPAHQQHFKSVITKMDETSVSGTQMLILMDKRKKYEIPKTQVPPVIMDEDGQEWVPCDTVPDDDGLQDAEREKKRRRDSGGDLNGLASPKRRKP